MGPWPHTIPITAFFIIHERAILIPAHSKAWDSEAVELPKLYIKKTGKDSKLQWIIFEINENVDNLNLRWNLVYLYVEAL